MTVFQKSLPFSGVATALVTPFSGGSLDLPALRRLIAYQWESGIHAVVVAGTTGEASTLTDEERDTVTREAVALLKGRVPVIVGTGSNDTRRAVEYSRRAAENGADALLVVTPYYNKGTERGIIEHYLRIADAVDIPVILYNVPSRTGVDLTLSQYEALAVHPRIVATKEAKGDVSRLADLRARFADGSLYVYTGNDCEFLPALSMGASGVVSVLSNLFPADMVNAYRLFLGGKVQEAAAIMRHLHTTARLLFRETNPAPVKDALSILGLCSPETRLPLSGVTDALHEALAAELKMLGL